MPRLKTSLFLILKTWSVSALPTLPAGQIRAVIVFAAKRTDRVGHVRPRMLHISRDPVPDLRITIAARATAIGAHVDQPKLAAVAGIVRLADLSRVRMHDPQRIDHHITTARHEWIDLHAVKAKDLRRGALVIL